LKEYGDKVDSGEKQNIEEAVVKAKKAMELNDPSAIKSVQEELTHSAHKLAEAMYAKASQKGATGPGAEAGPQEGPQKKPQEDVVDADFEDVGKK
jgi:molecular chaperone DnaK